MKPSGAKAAPGGLLVQDTFGNFKGLNIKLQTIQNMQKVSSATEQEVVTGSRLVTWRSPGKFLAGGPAPSTGGQNPNPAPRTEDRNSNPALQPSPLFYGNPATTHTHTHIRTSTHKHSHRGSLLGLLMNDSNEVSFFFEI